MKRSYLFTALAMLFTSGCFAQTYQGKAWNNSIPVIPGKIQCEFYDLGGEGVAYHDNDSVNGGSGQLNPANGTYLNEFRMNEHVGISYTKSNETDNNPYNFFNPELGQLYMGWTKPGDWVKFTIDVRETGNFEVGTLYTANGNGTIILSVDDNAGVTMAIPSTHRDDDPIDWRQWHHWNKIDVIGSITLAKGIHVLKLAVGENGNMNFDYLELKYKK